MDTSLTLPLLVSLATQQSLNVPPALPTIQEEPLAIAASKSTTHPVEWPVFLAST